MLLIPRSLWTFAVTRMLVYYRKIFRCPRGWGNQPLRLGTNSKSGREGADQRLLSLTHCAGCNETLNTLPGDGSESSRSTLVRVASWYKVGTRQAYLFLSRTRRSAYRRTGWWSQFGFKTGWWCATLATCGAHPTDQPDTQRAGRAAPARCRTRVCRERLRLSFCAPGVRS